MLPPGACAIGIFHGANLSNRLDNHFFGVPREQYGFSNNARGFMGPPSFEDAAFSMEHYRDFYQPVEVEA